MRQSGPWRQPSNGAPAVYHGGVSVVAAPESRRSWAQIVAVVALSLLVRAWLAPRYFGWEEGDYGNLMMIREVLDSRFTWFRPAHMPGWYSLGAVARVVGGGASRAPALWMTMGFSLLGIGVATGLARRLVSPAAAWLVGLWLAVQPETALYGASTLRSPVFATLGIVGFWLLLVGRNAGFVATAAAFLVRMEAFFVFFLPALLTYGPQRGRAVRALLPGALVLASVVVSWQVYLTVALHESGPFWAGPLGQNVAGSEEPGAWIRSGLSSAWLLLTWTLPRKVSWTCLTLAGVGVWAAIRGQGRPGARAVLGYASLTLGFWLAEGFLAQQDPNHNLFWVWLLPAIAPLVLLAALGWGWCEERLAAAPRGARALALGLVITSAAPSFLLETRYQMDRSERWYRPQLELARWLETHARPGAGMVLGSIPEVWIQRKEHPFRVTAWWFLPRSLQGQGPEAFGEFLVDQEIDYLMWFTEEWTEAPAVAPYLAAGEAVQAGAARLIPVDREDGYGWILYVVERPGATIPASPPPYGRGAPGPGWGP